MKKFSTAALLMCAFQADAFTSTSSNRCPTALDAKSKKSVSNAAAMVVSVGILANSFFPNNAFADEIGRETEAPTLSTGETVEICVKRGPLGACQKTELRTENNDNDKASKYFRDPQEKMREKYSAAQLQAIDSGDGVTTKTVADSEGNELIEKLRQASLDNKEKNDRIIRAKTLQNDLGASFGPLSNQVVILNSDGETFTLLEAPQAMRLKKAGYIKDKRFITQPSQQVIDDALEAPEEGGIGAVFKGIFGSD